MHLADATDPLASRAPFAGHYHLVTATLHRSCGVEVPISLSGQTYYDGVGRMWVLLVPPPSLVKEGDRSHHQGWSRAIGYYGSYDVDDRIGTITHHVEACLDPLLNGADLVRRYELSGSRLVLTFERDNHVMRTVYERFPSQTAMCPAGEV